MRTEIGRLAAGQPLPSYYRRSDRQRLRKRNRPQTADRGAGRSGHDFLKTEFHSLTPTKIERETDEGCVDLLTEENYHYLLECVRRYAGLLGKEFRHTPGRTLCGSFVNLYKELAALVPQEVNFEVHMNRLTFCLYEYHRWPEWTFHWLPVSFIDRLKGRLKRIAITFIHDFARNNGMSYLNEWGDLEWALEWMGEYASGPGPDKQEREKYRRTLRSYGKGHAIHLLERVQERCYYKRLRSAIDRYRPANEYEKGLIALFGEGLQFIGPAAPSIMHYLYDPYDDTGGRETVTVDSDRMIRVVYDSDDLLADNLSEMLNNEIQNCDYIVTPATTLFLTPELTEPFRKDDYPERFAEWFKRFVTFLSTHKFKRP